MINWSDYFDAIWCINFAKYTDRKTNIIKEFSRVGILNSPYFNFHTTVRNKFEDFVFDISKQAGANACKSHGEFSLAMGHYHCIKSSYEAGCERILLFEDDIKFLEDTDYIKNCLDRIPSDADICMFSYNPGLTQSMEKYVFDIKDEGYFTKVNYSLWDSGFYMMSRHAMKNYIEAVETEVNPSDIYVSQEKDIGNLKRYYSNKPLGIQLDYCDSLNNSHYYIYASENLDLSEYGERYTNLPEDINFGIVIPSFNSYDTIERCLNSLKIQEYKKWHAVIVDDCSTDKSLNIINKFSTDDNRFSVITLDKKRYGGGARNVGIDNLPHNIDYVLFVDSDDCLYSKYTLSTIFCKIKECNNPDCVFLPFKDTYNKKVVRLDFTSVPMFMAYCGLHAPWAKCIKKELIVKFEEGDLLGYDDVIQHYRQMDNVESVAYLKNIAYSYMFGSSESVHNTTNVLSNERQERVDVALVSTMETFLRCKFKHDYVTKFALKHFGNPNIKNALEIKRALNSRK